jgi:hypothetical protein
MEIFLDICNHVMHLISKHDTKVKKVIHVEFKVFCAIYKLAYGVNILICGEFFAIGKFITTFAL